MRAGELAGERVAEEDAGQVPRQPLRVGEAGVGQGLGGDVEGQPVGEVGGAEGGPGDAEAHAVEVPAVEHRGLGEVEAVRIARVAVEVVFEAQSLRRHAAEVASAGAHVYLYLGR